MTIDLAAARALVEAATDGPWCHERESRVFSGMPPDGGGGIGTTIAQWCLPRNAAFIAAARTLVPALLDALEAALEAAQNAETMLKSPEVHWECQQKIDALEAAQDSDRESIEMFRRVRDDRDELRAALEAAQRENERLSMLSINPGPTLHGSTILEIAAQRDALAVALNEACDMWERGRRTADKYRIAAARALAKGTSK